MLTAIKAKSDVTVNELHLLLAAAGLFVSLRGIRTQNAGHISDRPQEPSVAGDCLPTDIGGMIGQDRKSHLEPALLLIWVWRKYVHDLRHSRPD